MSQQGKDKNDGLHFLEKLSISQYLTVTFHQDAKLPKSLMNTFTKKEQVYKTRIFDIANSWYFVTGSLPEIKIWSENFRFFDVILVS